MKRSIRIHGNVNVFDGRLGSGIHDKNGREIFEGDTLDVDFRALFKKYGLGDVNLDFDLADSECPADFDKKIFDALDRLYNTFALAHNGKLVVQFGSGKFVATWLFDGGSGPSCELGTLAIFQDFISIR